MPEECAAASSKAADSAHAEAFPNHEITQIADTQVRRALQRRNQSAAQRAFDRMVRREIRRRGLTWSPPTS